MLVIYKQASSNGTVERSYIDTCFAPIPIEYKRYRASKILQIVRTSELETSLRRGEDAFCLPSGLSIVFSPQN